MSVEQTLILAKSWYEQFRTNIWLQQHSFHNWYHIEADTQATNKLLTAAIDGNDPLKIINDLVRWNQTHSDQQIEKRELLRVFEIALVLHDLGNILTTVIKLENDTYQPVFLTKYMAKDSEARSVQIAKILLENSSSIEVKTRYLPLILYLIEQTSFVFFEGSIFGLLVRLVDQVGTGLFDQNKTRLIGLLKEIVVENPQASFVPYDFFNFNKLRFGELVPDKNIRESLLKIWGKKLPSEKNKSKMPVKINDWLKNQI